MTHKLLSGHYVLVMTPNEMNNLIVSIERGRLYWIEKSGVQGLVPVTTGVGPAKNGGPTLSPYHRVEGCTSPVGVTYDIDGFYKDAAKIADEVKPK